MVCRATCTAVISCITSLFINTNKQEFLYKNTLTIFIDNFHWRHYDDWNRTLEKFYFSQIKDFPRQGGPIRGAIEHLLYVHNYSGVVKIIFT